MTADGVGIFIGLNVPADGLGGLVFLGAINSATPGPISSTAFGDNLTAGQTIDYLVWRGANGAQDSTGFRATLTQIPEPSTLILTTCGIAGLFFLRRRRFGQS